MVLHSLKVFCFTFFAFSASSLMAAINPGLLNDFESGTTEGWTSQASPTNIPSGGPAGVDDNYLQIGNGLSNLGAFNLTHSGLLDSSIVAIEVDMFRPATDPDIEMRLVLFGPGVSTSNRWTSTNSVLVPGDGQWATYSFSVLEADLTQVVGSATYADVVADLNRILFRFDDGAPSIGGSSIAGTLGLDNITAAIATAVPGDFDGDGFVGLSDLNILGSNFGTMGGATVATGDANGDGNVDLADLNLVGSNFNPPPAVAVPEPSTALLAFGSVALVVARRRTV